MVDDLDQELPSVFLIDFGNGVVKYNGSIIEMCSANVCTYEWAVRFLQCHV